MVIRETSVFTRRLHKLLDDESYRLLQLKLLLQPEAGVVIRGTRGLRKVRWQPSGRGKRGGVRIVYYWAAPQQVLLMLYVFGKNEKDDLTSTQRSVLRQLVEDEFK